MENGFDLERALLFNMCPSLSEGQVALMKNYIEDYVHSRIEYFPTVKLRPKHEYILHYSKLTEYFDILKHLWTLSFESKHAYFKNILKHLKNYKNLDFTMARKHELMQCSYKSQYNDQAILIRPVD